MPEPYVGKLASTVLRGRKLPGVATARNQKAIAEPKSGRVGIF